MTDSKPPVNAGLDLVEIRHKTPKTLQWKGPTRYGYVPCQNMIETLVKRGRKPARTTYQALARLWDAHGYTQEEMVQWLYVRVIDPRAADVCRDQGLGHEDVRAGRLPKKRLTPRDRIIQKVDGIPDGSSLYRVSWQYSVPGFVRDVIDQALEHFGIKKSECTVIRDTFSERSDHGIYYVAIHDPSKEFTATYAPCISCLPWDGLIPWLEDAAE